ncbi:MAG TPA: hypothetical protein PKW66_23150, partial [Polyangiaceae bacterium]|nr:hypothetical protein [Polyangiaceae bacterium]
PTVPPPTAEQDAPATPIIVEAAAESPPPPKAEPPSSRRGNLDATDPGADRPSSPQPEGASKITSPDPRIAELEPLLASGQWEGIVKYFGSRGKRRKTATQPRAHLRHCTQRIRNG